MILPEDVKGSLQMKLVATSRETSNGSVATDSCNVMVHVDTKENAVTLSRFTD